jgi:hypothetical protein
MSMSWSVNASGKIEDVVEELAKQFSMPLAEPPAGLSNEGERETVKLVSDVVEQCLGTFAADRLVKVSANGHLGYNDWEKKDGAYQEVNVSIGILNG